MRIAPALIQQVSEPIDIVARVPGHVVQGASLGVSLRWKVFAGVPYEQLASYSAPAHSDLCMSK